AAQHAPRVQQLQQQQRRRAARRPAHRTALHPKRVTAISAMRASLTAQPLLPSAPSRLRSCVQGDASVGLTTSDVVSLTKLKKKRAMIVAHCGTRIDRCSVVGSPYTMVVTAKRAMQKLGKYDQAINDASDALRALVLGANSRGSAVVVGRAEKMKLSQLR
ncbi:hypothetical protein PFISCL1PPCAC_1587, partial [Pristionchus fissidentatus]